MARVTIEDCVEKVEDRFELVALAARRAKDINAGSPLHLERNNEKNTVLALREIAADCVSAEELRENLLKQHQKERLVTQSAYSEGTEVSDAELEGEDFELKQLEKEEQELSSDDELSANVLPNVLDDEILEAEEASAEAKAAAESFEDLDFDDENLDDLND